MKCGQRPARMKEYEAMSNTDPEQGWGASNQAGASNQMNESAEDVNRPQTDSTERDAQAQNPQNPQTTSSPFASDMQDVHYSDPAQGAQEQGQSQNPVANTQPLSSMPTQSIPDLQPDYQAAVERPAEQTGYRATPDYGAYAQGQYGAAQNPYGQGQYGAVQNQQDATQAQQNTAQYGAQRYGTAYGSAGQPGYRQPAYGQRPYGQNAYTYAHQSAQGAPGAPGTPTPGVPNAAMPNGGMNGGMNGDMNGDMNEQKTAVKREHHASPVLTAIIAAIVAVALSLGLGYAALTKGWIKVSSTGTTTTTTLNSSTGSDTGSSTAVADGSDWVTVAKNVNDSVVSILVNTNDGAARGSGAVLDTDGHIVTNNHVVSGATQIYVTMSNGDMYSASVTGTDATTDLAVIKLDTVPDNLTPITFADSDNLAVGEAVMAIGNPLGLSNTTTTGIVSALNRPVTTYDETSQDSSLVVTNAIQIDAAINPGNSGGPTFNSAGQVIGINSSIATASSGSSSSSSSSGSIGIGFAIPSNLVSKICQQIIDTGSAEHVQMGVRVKTNYVQYNDGYRAGAEITQVTSGSSAETAGLQAGDLVVAYNGNLVNGASSLLGYVRASSKGDTVKLTVIRNGQMQDVQVQLNDVEKI